MATVYYVEPDVLLNDDTFYRLVEEYAEESKMRGMPQPDFDVEMYKKLGSMGIMQCLAAKDGDELVGFMVLLATVVPHYSKMVVTTESLFVGKSHRKGGAGMKLIKEAEAFAVKKGAVGILLSAPEGERLADIAPKIGYVKASNVFFKGLM